MTPPRTAPVLDVLVGPTGHGLPARLLSQDGVRLHPPARRGSIAALVEHLPPGRILLVDGRYDDVPAVGHREILDAIAAGWQVTGLGSIGALRAAELDGFGMSGYGRVFAHLRDSGAPDDEVALLHGPAPDYRPITEALVDLRAFAEHLADAGVIGRAAACDAVGALAGRWFGDRSLPALLHAVEATAGRSAAAAARTYLPRMPAIRWKSADLTAYLTEQSWTRSPAPSRSCPRTAAAGPDSTTVSTHSGC
ncbi:TfuA-like protein [Streptomyces sp. NPDC056883]|uniref:TfuA-like protein n=1 Tax=Streptomyces sp. NPDC056883 TaxID=3345959 RepID=UPI0036A12B15